MHWWKTKTGQSDQSLENSILMAFMMICCYFHTYLFLKTGYKSFQFEYSRERKKCVFDWCFRRWFMPFNVDGLNRCIIYIENIVKLWLSCEESLFFFKFHNPLFCHHPFSVIQRIWIYLFRMQKTANGKMCNTLKMFIVVCVIMALSILDALVKNGSLMRKCIA